MMIPGEFLFLAVVIVILVLTLRGLLSLMSAVAEARLRGEYGGEVPLRPIGPLLDLVVLADARGRVFRTLVGLVLMIGLLLLDIENGKGFAIVFGLVALAAYVFRPWSAGAGVAAPESVGQSS